MGMSERAFQQTTYCPDYVPRRPSLTEEAGVLRKMAARYVLLSEKGGDVKLADAIFRFASEIDERADFLTRCQTNPRLSACASCAKEPCLLRQVKFIEPLIAVQRA
jgi:hypothetical protein